MTTLQEFKVLGDYRGQLIALEANRQIPFDVKRVFYIYGTQEGVPRGNHSHYKTKQFLVAVNGSCKVTLDDGEKKETFDLNRPNLGLFQDAFVWGTMHNFSSDCVLMVLANEYYDASDYITDYDKFLKESNKEIYCL
ncbi:FdtA/QdtA family cupin domain-containing protein [Aliarcobacter butzleri]|uniref:sugar 3,4-ketoisomerase n=1 Tax=Aliarcobacter butzleri TaxID=28197 RepID=UPI0021B1BD1E|nr:FdtA/QdtA family cupin domain-containing protein [Aliarcobacter butzleri]MCT7612965.1 FdtA/QdtA family cupin domain-containing protein [Aliarcobacter butzleri]MCT7641600.1 FdtA/QdtA family cupin domain-containing protein [Aliarcobacter butzleri]